LGRGTVVNGPSHRFPNGDGILETLAQRFDARELPMHREIDIRSVKGYFLDPTVVLSVLVVRREEGVGRWRQCPWSKTQFFSDLIPVGYGKQVREVRAGSLG
jgi:hypothetical protein